MPRFYGIGHVLCIQSLYLPGSPKQLLQHCASLRLLKTLKQKTAVLQSTCRLTGTKKHGPRGPKELDRSEALRHAEGSRDEDGCNLV